MRNMASPENEWAIQPVEFCALKPCHEHDQNRSLLKPRGCVNTALVPAAGQAEVESSVGVPSADDEICFQQELSRDDSAVFSGG